MISLAAVLSSIAKASLAHVVFVFWIRSLYIYECMYISICISISSIYYAYIYMVPPMNPTSFHDALSLLPSMDTYTYIRIIIQIKI